MSKRLTSVEVAADLDRIIGETYLEIRNNYSSHLRGAEYNGLFRDRFINKARTLIYELKNSFTSYPGNINEFGVVVNNVQETGDVKVLLNTECTNFIEWLSKREQQ